MNWTDFIERYVEGLRVTNYAANTLDLTVRWLRRFAESCGQAGASTPLQATATHVERFRQELLWERGQHGRLYSQNTVSQALTTVRSFFRWATRRENLLVDPTAKMVLPRVLTSPRRPLTIAEASRLIDSTDDSTPSGLRDRAVLETLYSTGLRRSECHLLDVADVDLEGHNLRIHGKGGHERLVPIGDALATVLERYLRDSRPRLASGELRQALHASVPATPDSAALFISLLGTRYSVESIAQLVVRAAQRAGLGRLNTHALRHAFATHLLEGGADYFAVQALLGHRHPQSTSIYTHVSLRELAHEHLRTHPRARRQRPPQS